MRRLLKKKQAKCALHPACQKLLLWGLRILLVFGFAIAYSIYSDPLLPLWQAKERISTLLLSGLLLLIGAMILDIDCKKNAEHH